MFSFDNISKLVEGLKIIAYFLPLIWGVFVLVEWDVQKGYFAKFNISQHFSADYKIAINPRYFLSLLLTLIIMGIIYCLSFAWQLFLSFCVLTFLIYLFFRIKKSILTRHIVMLRSEKNKLSSKVRKKLARKIRKIRRKMQKKPDKKEKYNNKLNLIRKKFEGDLVAADYKKSIQKWGKHQFNSYTFLAMFGIAVIGFLVTARDISEFVYSLLPMLRDILSGSLKNIGGVRTFACLLWAIISAGLVHRVLHRAIVSYITELDYIENFRIMIKDNITYAILAPTSSDNNSVSVAMRTIICKKENGLIYSYLIPDQVITKKAPFEGESFILDVDVVTSIPTPNKQLSLFSDAQVVEKLIKEDVKEYFNCKKKWVPINTFISNADNGITIIRNTAEKEKAFKWSKQKNKKDKESLKNKG